MTYELRQGRFSCYEAPLMVTFLVLWLIHSHSELKEQECRLEVTGWVRLERVRDSVPPDDPDPDGV